MTCLCKNMTHSNAIHKLLPPFLHGVLSLVILSCVYLLMQAWGCVSCWEILYQLQRCLLSFQQLPKATRVCVCIANIICWHWCQFKPRVVVKSGPVMQIMELYLLISCSSVSSNPGLSLARDIFALETDSQDDCHFF